MKEEGSPFCKRGSLPLLFSPTRKRNSPTLTKTFERCRMQNEEYPARVILSEQAFALRMRRVEPLSGTEQSEVESRAERTCYRMQNAE